MTDVFVPPELAGILGLDPTMLNKGPEKEKKAVGNAPEGPWVPPELAGIMGLDPTMMAQHSSETMVDGMAVNNVKMPEFDLDIGLGVEETGTPSNFLQFGVIETQFI